jgi:hypothetical protein
MLAIKNIHFEKGTLLEYGRIQLAEQLPLSASGVARPQTVPALSAPVQPLPTPAAPPTPLPLPAAGNAPESGQPAPTPPLPNFPALGQPVGLPLLSDSQQSPRATGPAVTAPALPSRLPSPRQDFGLPPRDPMSQWTPAIGVPPQVGGSQPAPAPVVTVSPSTGLIERTWFLKEPPTNSAPTANAVIPTSSAPGNPAQASWSQAPPPPSQKPTAPAIPRSSPLVRLPPPEAEPRAENAMQRLPSP